MSRAISGVKPESLSGLTSAVSNVRSAEVAGKVASKVVRAHLKFKHTDAKLSAPVSKHEQALGCSHNSGVSERAARDMVAHIAASSSSSSALPNSARDHLARKAALYEKLVSTGVSGEGDEGVFLVDFERKGWERQDQLSQGIDLLNSKQQHPQDLLNNYEKLNAPGATMTSSSSSTHSSFAKVAAAAHSLEAQRSDWEQAALKELQESGDQAKREADRANVIAQAESSGGGRMMLRQQAYAMHEEALQETKEARAKWLERKKLSEQLQMENGNSSNPVPSMPAHSTSSISTVSSLPPSISTPPAAPSASSIFIPESARLQAMQESSNARAAWLEKRKRKMTEENSTALTTGTGSQAAPLEQEGRKARLEQLRRESLERS